MEFAPGTRVRFVVDLTVSAYEDKDGPPQNVNLKGRVGTVIAADIPEYQFAASLGWTVVVQVDNLGVQPGMFPGAPIVVAPDEVTVIAC